MFEPRVVSLASTADDDANTEVLGDLTGWRPADDGGAIERTFDFPDFASAFGFICSVALAAERSGLLPEWSNLGGRVDIRLNSHDAGPIGEQVVMLAQAINDLLLRAFC